MSDRQITTRIAVPAMLGGLFLLSGCSTVQENPNYQFSSKYKGAETVTVAETSPSVATDTAPIVAASNSEQAASPTEDAYNADQMIGTPGYAILLAEQAQERNNAAATPAPATPAPYAPAPYVYVPAPAAEAIPAPQPLRTAPTTGPREVTYDYAQNVIANEGAITAPVPAPIPAPVAEAPSSTPITVPTGQTYVVQPGDTVYSLSRRLCTPITEIMTANGIGADFAIDIGQSLTLPTSRC